MEESGNNLLLGSCESSDWTEEDRWTGVWGPQESGFVAGVEGRGFNFFSMMSFSLSSLEGEDRPTVYLSSEGRADWRGFYHRLVSVVIRYFERERDEIWKNPDKD